MPNGRLHGLRVVAVNNFAGPGMGGGEVQLLPVLAALLAEGADVRLLAPAGAELSARARELGVATSESPFGVRHVPAAISAISQQACQDPVATRTIFLGTGYFTNMLARRAARRCSALAVNIVGVVPGASAFDGGSHVSARVRALIDRVTARDVDAVVAVSAAVREAVIAVGIPAERVHLIHNGVDLEALRRRADESRADALPAGRPLIGCVARLEPVKGVEFLVRAMAELPDATLAIAGEGSQESRLREIATAARITGRVHFVGASYAAALLRAADVVVVPSLSEGFGLVAVEAGVFARPVVASCVGGLAEVVEDGVTGVLVTPGDSPAIARAVTELLRAPEYANTLGAAGRARAEACFTSARMADEYVNLFADLAARPPR